MNDTYDSLAGCYDAMTEDIDYSAWADFLENLFSSHAQKVRTVLDLACGTGTMSCLLTERGYEVIGVDFSPEMLAVAAEKASAVSGEPPIFLCQSMEELDLYGTVDACVCLLDSVNHMTDPDALREAFHRIWLFLEPGGIFIFDVHTPEHLRSLDGGIFLDETEDAYCVWRTDFDPDVNICTYAMDVFFRQSDGLWSRDEEVHEEYAYTVPELKRYLDDAGFIEIALPRESDDRIFFSARKPREL